MSIRLAISFLAFLALASLGMMVALSTPANALTLNQAKALAGCSTSPCVSTSTGTRSELVPGGAEIIINAPGVEASTVSPDAGCGFTYGFVDSFGDCIPGSSVGSSGGSTVIGYTQDSTKTVNTLTTTTNEIVRVGPAAPGAGPWDVVTTTTTVDAP